MAQQYKIDKVEALKEYFKNKSDMVFSDYRGLNVEKITEIRDELRKSNSKMMVVKNNYVKVICKELGISDLGDNVVGPTAITFVEGEVNEVAKVLFKFEKETELDIKGGLISDSLLGRDQLEALSQLPGREQLIAMVMATMNAPVQNFTFACNDILGRMVRVLDAVKNQKENAS